MKKDKKKVKVQEEFVPVIDVDMELSEMPADFSDAEEEVSEPEIVEQETEVEISEVKEENQEVKSWFFKEYLESPVLGEAVRLYVQYKNEDCLYEVLKKYFSKHSKEKAKILAYLNADKEKHKCWDYVVLAIASVVVCVIGIMIVMTGASMNALIAAFVAMAACFMVIFTYLLKCRECNCMREFLLTVLCKPGKYWKK